MQAVAPTPRLVRAKESSGQPGLAVVAFGGNAILQSGQRGTLEEQVDNLSVMASQLARMIAAGWSVVVTHGNGPQVGNIKLQQDRAEPEVPAMPLDVCGAMSQGQIGYLLEQALSTEFARQGITRSIVTVLTRCVVDPEDPAFSNSTKPIGPFYDAGTAETLRQQKGWTMVSDSGRGFRRVVPSPVPRAIVESESIRLLADSGVVVIASGGGGVPVVRGDNGGYTGIEAVIDKDLAACLLAEEVGADTLIMLTEVPQVMIDYRTPRARPLGDVSELELRRFAMEGQFPAGSMGPKVQGALGFISRGGLLAVITTPDLMLEAISGRAGTRIHPETEDRPAPLRTPAAG